MTQPAVESSVVTAVQWIIALLCGVHRMLAEGSPLAPHMRRGDMLLSVNECPVRSSADWLACITGRQPWVRGTAALAPACTKQQKTLRQEPSSQGNTPWESSP